MKNLLFLICLSVMALVHARGPVKQESISEAENYKLESATKEKGQSRAFAGEKAKKEVQEPQVQKEDMTTGEDSEVRYWKYSE
jgi:hypothetical protein